MNKAESLIGRKFGKLEVLEHSHYKNGKHYWKCKCECGNIANKAKSSSDLKSGKVRSCGCLRDEMFSINRRKTHGKSKTRLFRIWSSMLQRCYYKNGNAYKDYGARGIEVCEEWRRDFEQFHSWAIGNGYEPDLTIDRIDNNKGYSEDNCRWATYEEQNRNRRNNVIIEYEGESFFISDLATKLGLNKTTLSNRIKSGWEEKELAMVPALNNRIVRRASNE